jgi:hypothetical protein
MVALLLSSLSSQLPPNWLTTYFPLLPTRVLLCVLLRSAAGRTFLQNLTRELHWDPGTSLLYTVKFNHPWVGLVACF